MKTTAFPVSRLHFPSWSGLTARVPDFIALMKPRVMVLAVFTTAVGLFIAPGDLDPLLGSSFDYCYRRGRRSAAGVLGILIVILVAAGSIWIMTNLNENMMPPPELMTRDPPRGRICSTERLRNDAAGIEPHVRR